MKRLVLFFGVITFAFSLSTTVLFAENSTNEIFGNDFRDKKQEVKKEIKQEKSEFKEREASKRAEFKEKEASKRAEIKDKTEEKRKELLNKRFTYLSRHLNAYYERLGKIEEKIKTRIAKLKEKGVNTSAAEAKLAAVASAKAAAKTAIDKAVLDAQSVGSADDPKTATDTALASIKAAKTALFNYHKALVDVVKELKAARSLREGTMSAHEE